MPSLSAWWVWDQRNIFGWGSQTRRTKMFLSGPTQNLWDLLTGILKCQVMSILKILIKCTVCERDFTTDKLQFCAITKQGDIQGCVAMATGSFAGLWDVLPCTNREKFICKHLAEMAVVTPAPPTVPSTTCESGWTKFKSRNLCYKVKYSILTSDIYYKTLLMINY